MTSFYHPIRDEDVEREIERRIKDGELSEEEAASSEMFDLVADDLIGDWSDARHEERRERTSLRQ